MNAYCVKCREKVEVKDPKDVTMKNGRPAITGTCIKCGTKVFSIKSTKNKWFQQAAFLKSECNIWVYWSVATKFKWFKVLYLFLDLKAIY